MTVRRWTATTRRSSPVPPWWWTAGDSAPYLAGLPLKGVGEDTISLDPCDSVDFPNHMTLLGADFVNTENLKGLDKLLGRRFTFVTLPLKFENADGCSCRAIALEE